MSTWKRYATAILLGTISLGIASNPAAKRTGRSIGAFVYYFQALGKPDASAGFWERLTVSLALAGAGNGRPECAHNHPRPRPSML
ncbi:MAG TPA: hypothetical protein VF767_11875 [Bryobacteraceae bacterium]